MDFEPKNKVSIFNDGRVDRNGNFVVGGFISDSFDIKLHLKSFNYAFSRYDRV